MRWDVCPLRQFEALGEQLPREVEQVLTFSNPNNMNYDFGLGDQAVGGD